MVDDGPCWLEGCPRGREESTGRDISSAPTYWVPGWPFIGLGMCSEPVYRKQNLSPVQSWLANKEMGRPGRGEPHL